MIKKIKNKRKAYYNNERERILLSPSPCFSLTQQKKNSITHPSPPNLLSCYYPTSSLSLITIKDC